MPTLPGYVLSSYCALSAKRKAEHGTESSSRQNRFSVTKVEFEANPSKANFSEWNISHQIKTGELRWWCVPAGTPLDRTVTPKLSDRNWRATYSRHLQILPDPLASKFPSSLRSLLSTVKRSFQSLEDIRNQGGEGVGWEHTAVLEAQEISIF